MVVRRPPNPNWPCSVRCRKCPAPYVLPGPACRRDSRHPAGPGPHARCGTTNPFVETGPRMACPLCPETPQAAEGRRNPMTTASLPRVDSVAPRRPHGESVPAGACRAWKRRPAVRPGRRPLAVRPAAPRVRRTFQPIYPWAGRRPRRANTGPGCRGCPLLPGCPLLLGMPSAAAPVSGGTRSPTGRLTEIYPSLAGGVVGDRRAPTKPAWFGLKKA